MDLCMDEPHALRVDTFRAGLSWASATIRITCVICAKQASCATGGEIKSMLQAKEVALDLLRQQHLPR